MASFVNIHRRLARTRAIDGSLSWDDDLRLWGVGLCCEISQPSPWLNPPAWPHLLWSVAKAGAAGLLQGGAIITLLLLPKLRCSHMWSHCCLRDVPGFGLFPQNPCLCISFLPQPSLPLSLSLSSLSLSLLYLSLSPSLCLSLSPYLPHYADKQPGAMAVEEVTLWHLLWGSACHADRVSLPPSLWRGGGA